MAIINHGIGLSDAMAAARALYGEQYNPMLTLKSLTYFGDGDLHKLTDQQKKQLLKVVSTQKHEMPVIPRSSDSLSLS